MHCDSSPLSAIKSQKTFFLSDTGLGIFAKQKCLLFMVKDKQSQTLVKVVRMDFDQEHSISVGKRVCVKGTPLGFAQG